MSAGPLVDTSVLIDYFGGIVNPETEALDRLLNEGPAPSTAPVIVQEYLQGLRTTRELINAKKALRLFHRLDPPDYALHETAARLVAGERRRGKTYSTVDTLIVVMAREAGCGLLTRDAAQIELARALRVPVIA